MFLARRVFKRCRGGEHGAPQGKPHQTMTDVDSHTTMTPDTTFLHDEDETEASYSHQPSKRLRRADDFFPEFDLPDAAEVTDMSSDEESVTQREEEFKTKEDQDVQGAARAQNNIIDDDANPMMEYSVLLNSRRKIENKGATQSPPVAKQKKFRFAEVSDNKVRAVVHEVESYKDIPELWWSNEEMMEIRMDKVRVVKHFRKYRPNFLQSVEILVNGNEKKDVLEDHMRRLTEDSFARGLETHSVRCISDRRKSHIHAVLQEQEDCRETGDTYEMASHCIREQSLAYSKLLTEFALRMAKCDQIDALKASMSVWETPEPEFA
eukprot:scaffold37799_cov176-Amphora_coffeaeformis.AAC.3